MSIGAGVIRGHFVTLRRFALTFWRDIRAGNGLKRRGGGTFFIDLFRTPGRGDEPTVQQDFKTDGLFTVEYPDERLPVYERFRVLPVLIYDTEDGNVRCTSCNICARRFARRSVSGCPRPRARRGRSFPCLKTSISTWTCA